MASRFDRNVRKQPIKFPYSVTAHMQMKISSIYKESTTGVNVRTGRESVGTISARINKANLSNN